VGQFRGPGEKSSLTRIYLPLPTLYRGLFFLVFTSRKTTILLPGGRSVKKQVAAIFLLILGAASGLWAQDAAQNSDQPASLAGTWQMSWQGRRGDEQGTLKIQQDGSKLSGSFDGPRGSSALTGTVQGSQVSFNVQMKGRRTFTVVYTGTVDGDKMSGTIQRQNGEARGGDSGRGEGEPQNRTWTATRQQSNPGSQSRPAQSQEDGEQDGL
jgi:hypothetical protein